MATGHKKPRIIAGEAGGRRLSVPPGDGVRPTSDRVKESIFSALGPARLVGARVLDLYAGSGALGLEALSRGAAGALLVERDAAAARAIGANIATLGFAERATLRVATVATVLHGPGPVEPFDLVLLDRRHRGGGAVRRLAAAGVAPAMGVNLGALLRRYTRVVCATQVKERRVRDRGLR